MHKKILALTLPAAALNYHGPLIAQEKLAEEDSPVSVEEVIVTARKRDENLQEVPIAITAFTERKIEQAGIQRPGDFISLTPNVTIIDTSNVGDTQVTIRGQVSTRDAEGTFAYVVDGVLVTNPNGFNEELFDLQQIEVLKGPQGALYGRNAVAGAIIVTTKAPSDTFTASLRGGVGSNNLGKASFSLSGPINDNLGYSLAMSYREDEGQFTNSFTNENGTIDYFEDTTARARLLWRPSEQLSVDLQTGASNVSGGAINYNASFALNSFPGTKLYADVNQHQFQYYPNTPGENQQDNFSFSIKSDYDMAWATFTAVLAYDDLQEYLLADGTSASFGIYAATESCASNDGEPSDFVYPDPFGVSRDGNAFNDLLPPFGPTTCDGYQYQERNQSNTTLELKLSGENDALSWVGGLYFADISREVIVAYGADLGEGFSRSGLVLADGPDPTDSLFSDDYGTQVTSIFSQLEYQLTESQELALAARWDREAREIENNVPRLESPNNPFTTYINPYYDLNPGETQIPERDKTFNQLQPKISWRMALATDKSAYASYGLGFRSGGFNASGSQALINSQYAEFRNSDGELTGPQNLRDDYDKEITKSLELGVKTQWLKKRLQVNAAVFDTQVENSQFFNFFASGVGIQRIITNIDEVSIQGIEVDFTYLVNSQIEVYGSYGLVDSKIEKNRNRPYTEGNKMPLAPEDTLNLGLSHSVNVSGELSLNTRLDWQYIGKTWFSTVQNNTTENSFTAFGFGYSEYSQSQRQAFDLLNLRISLESDRWLLTAWGKNITNEQYLEEVIPAPEFGGSFVHEARGEVYGLDFTYRF